MLFMSKRARNGLARENLELRERVKTVEKKIDELKRAFEELEKHT